MLLIDSAWTAIPEHGRPGMAAGATDRRQAVPGRHFGFRGAAQALRGVGSPTAAVVERAWWGIRRGTSDDIPAALH